MKTLTKATQPVFQQESGSGCGHQSVSQPSPPCIFNIYVSRILLAEDSATKPRVEGLQYLLPSQGAAWELPCVRSALSLTSWVRRMPVDIGTNKVSPGLGAIRPGINLSSILLFCEHGDAIQPLLLLFFNLSNGNDSNTHFSCIMQLWRINL